MSKKDDSITMPDGTTLSYTTLIEFKKCVFCNSPNVRIVEFEDGNFGGLHGKPECLEFNSMDLVEYMRRSREIMEKEIDDALFKPN